MKKSVAIAGAIACALSIQVSAETNGKPAINGANGKTAAYARACHAGHDAYGVPAADTCWIAYDAARTRGDVQGALAAMSSGCFTHRRADFCAFMTHVGEGARPHVVRVNVQNARLARALDEASAQIWAVEVEDAELGPYMRAMGGQ